MRMVFTRTMTRLATMTSKSACRWPTIKLISSCPLLTSPKTPTSSSSTLVKKLRISNVFLTCLTKRNLGKLTPNIYRLFWSVWVEIQPSQTNCLRILTLVNQDSHSLSFWLLWRTSRIDLSLDSKKAKHRKRHKLKVLHLRKQPSKTEISMVLYCRELVFIFCLIVR